MRTGTPGFVGERLRQARLAMKLTQTQLAELLEKKPNTISAYEAEKITPGEEVLTEISRLLGQPLEFFHRPVITKLGSGTVFYRSMSAATKAARDKAEVRLGWLREITTFAAEYIEFPEVNFPEFPNLPTDPMQISNEMIEEVAQWVRGQWNLGERPVANLVRTMEANGAIIAVDYLDAVKLDALSEWGFNEGIPYVVLNADKESAVRSRLDLAHELGHLFLHRHIDRDALNKGPLFKLIEDQAFYFAGALLLPREAFLRDLYSITLDVMKSLKPKWKVSIGAMIMRAKSLGVLSDDAMDKLWFNYSSRKWRKREPYDDQWESEKPTLLPQAMEMLIQEKIFNVDEVEQEIGIGKRYLQALCNLPENYFVSDPSPLKLIKFA